MESIRTIIVLGHELPATVREQIQNAVVCGHAGWVNNVMVNGIFVQQAFVKAYMIRVPHEKSLAGGVPEKALETAGDTEESVLRLLTEYITKAVSRAAIILVREDLCLEEQYGRVYLSRERSIFSQ